MPGNSESAIGVYVQAKQFFKALMSTDPRSLTFFLKFLIPRDTSLMLAGDVTMQEVLEESLFTSSDKKSKKPVIIASKVPAVVRSERPAPGRSKEKLFINIVSTVRAI